MVDVLLSIFSGAFFNGAFTTHRLVKVGEGSIDGDIQSR